MLVALTGLLWIFVTSGLTLFHKVSAQGIDPSFHGQPLFRRALEGLERGAQNSHPQFITAIVSGHARKAQGRF
jgi:hypothetical protein